MGYLVEIELSRKYDATIKIRRSIGLEVMPEVERYDGKRIRVEAYWQIEEDDPRYPGEYAMVVDREYDFPRAWIASGDLVDLELVQSPDMLIETRPVDWPHPFPNPIALKYWPAL